MQLNKQHSLFEHAITLFIAIVASMPLLSNWFGAGTVTYLFYLFGMAGAVALNYGSRLHFSQLDIPVLIFFLAYLFSIFYAVNPEFKTEALFIPLLFVLYYGGKGIAKNHLTHLLLNYISILFILFSIYLLYQLSQANFAYNAYYFYSTASNKVDYLTTTMYAGITFIYAIYGIRSQWPKLPLALYSFFIVAISGARFSIFFITLVGIIWIFTHIKKTFFSYKFILASIVLVISSFFVSDYISKQKVNDISSMFEFSLMRLGQFNEHGRSINIRENLISKSIDKISEHPFLGYGINSSPIVIDYVYPHNMFLEAWLDTGLMGLISLASIVVFMLLLAYKWRHKSDLLFLSIINVYIVLAHLKSFSILHSILFFVFVGITFSTYRNINQKNSYKSAIQ